MTSTIAVQGQRRWTAGTVGWVVGGAVAVSSLAWVDAVFLPLVLLGPVLAGVVVGLRHGARLPLAATWFLAGLAMLASDWVVNDEDRAFHLALAFVMAGLASGAHWLTTSFLQARSSRSTRGLPAGEAQSRAASPGDASRPGRARR